VGSLVLAGGASSRMGTDKALLVYHGMPQVHHLVKLLKSVASPTFVSVRPSQVVERGFCGLSLLPDLAEGIGPLAGLLAAFGHDPNRAWLVVAVDLPWVERGTFERLLAARDPALFATCYRIPSTDLLEPVCAIYEPKIYSVLQEAQRKKRYSLMLLRDVPIRLVAPRHERELCGVNDLEEYRAAREGPPRIPPEFNPPSNPRTPT